MQRLHPEGPSGGTRETRFLRDELIKYEEEINQLQKDMKEKDQQLVEERTLCEKYVARFEEAEKELRDLRKEVRLPFK
jgi:centrosomal protein CEP290